MKIKDKIEELRNKLNKYNKYYYEFSSPLVDDSEYDMLMKELIDLECKHPDLIVPESPSKKVGTGLSDDLKKVKHRYQMLSLANAFSIEDLNKFSNQISNVVEENYSFFVEPKIDGLSISLIYEKGLLTKGITRGDGTVGEDVTENVRTISSIPKKINVLDDYFEVRGEVYISKEEFEKINHNRFINNEKLFANPRNAASGSLRQLDSNITKERNLDCWLYYYFGNKNFKTHSESLEYLKGLGFKINQISSKAKNIEEAYKKVNEIISLRQELNYEIDGAVIKIDQLNLYDKIGYTSKVPKWAIAYKFPAEIKQTKLLNIITTLGRTGKITYNAVLEPVQIAGTIVRSATLHNWDFIADRDIRIGSIVKIKKAGDIIPEVIESIKDNKFESFPKYQKAIRCPVCESELQNKENEVDQYCLNNNCKGRIVKNIEHFVSRPAMNVEGLSEKLINKLYDSGLIKDISDLYTLKEKEEELIKLDKMGHKMANNIFSAIEKSKLNSSELLLFGLGIRYIGKKMSDSLLKVFKDINKLKSLNTEDLLRLNDVGPVASSSLVEWFSNSKNINLLSKLENLALNFKYTKGVNVSNTVITNKKFVITGTLSKSRDWFVSIIEKNGGNIISAITKNTDYLLLGDNPGSKYDKAVALNIKIINEEQFLEIIGE